MGFDDLTEEEVKAFHEWAADHDGCNEEMPGKWWYRKRRIKQFFRRLYNLVMTPWENRATARYATAQR